MSVTHNGFRSLVMGPIETIHIWQACIDFPKFHFNGAKSTFNNNKIVKSRYRKLQIGDRKNDYP